MSRDPQEKKPRSNAIELGLAFSFRAYAQRIPEASAADQAIDVADEGTGMHTREIAFGLTEEFAWLSSISEEGYGCFEGVEADAAAGGADEHSGKVFPLPTYVGR